MKKNLKMMTLGLVILSILLPFNEYSYAYTDTLVTPNVTNTTPKVGTNVTHNTSNSVITVKNVKELMATEQSTKKGNVTVLIEDGTYELTKGLWLTGKNITYKSKSGNREKVVLKGNFKASHIFWITNDDITIQDLSVGEVKNHAIQIHSELDADRAHIINVRFFDTKEQMLKGSGSKNNSFSDNCLVENCLFEFTSGTAYQYYTGGIDVHKGKNWTVKNNIFKNIQFPKGNLTEGAIHFWNYSSGTQIIGNTILNCDRGIMLGLDNSPHENGLIENNLIEVTRDVGIYLCNATQSKVVGNTVFTNSNYKNSIEYRFKTTDSIIQANTTNRAITSRNGGTAKISENEKMICQSYSDQAFEFYPDFELDLATALQMTVQETDTLKANSLYIQKYTNGVVIVNPDEINSYTYLIPVLNRIEFKAKSATILIYK